MLIPFALLAVLLPLAPTLDAADNVKKLFDKGWWKPSGRTFSSKEIDELVDILGYGMPEGTEEVGAYFAQNANVTRSLDELLTEVHWEGQIDNETAEEFGRAILWALYKPTIDVRPSIRPDDIICKCTQTLCGVAGGLELHEIVENLGEQTRGYCRTQYNGACKTTRKIVDGKDVIDYICVKPGEANLALECAQGLKHTVLCCNSHLCNRNFGVKDLKVPNEEVVLPKYGMSMIQDEVLPVWSIILIIVLLIFLAMTILFSILLFLDHRKTKEMIINLPLCCFFAYGKPYKEKNIHHQTQEMDPMMKKIVDEEMKGTSRSPSPGLSESCDIKLKEMNNDEDSCTHSMLMNELTAMITTSELNGGPKGGRLMQLLHELDSTYGGNSGTGSGSGAPRLVHRTIARQIELVDKVGAGRYGEVYCGRWRGELVAVKIFSSRDELSWNREMETYNSSMLRHNNILRFIAADRFDNGINTELWMITEYHPNGSLFDYLQSHTITLHQYILMARSIANGLAYLHQEIPGMENLSKPAIAHRDLKMRNILVKNDGGTCVVADLGLSVRMMDNGQLNLPPNHKSGTIRYLSPELLNESLRANRFDSYASADVYAFTLMMWEMAQRIEEPSRGMIAVTRLEDAIAFYEWVGMDPTIAAMKECVCDHMKDGEFVKGERPKFDAKWHNDISMRELMRMLSFNWGVDPEARAGFFNIRMAIEAAAVLGGHHLPQLYS